MSHETKNKPEPTITVERALELINAVIDRMINDAGGHVREVIGTLSDLGFTKEELIEVFRFSAADVADCLDEP